MKEFDIKLAKQGKPVCTRNGLPVRILCFDLKSRKYPIVAAIMKDGTEMLDMFTIDGKYRTYRDSSDFDLMMVSEKHEGWINVYENNLFDNVLADTSPVYATKEEAINSKTDIAVYIGTFKFEWEK